MGFYGNYYVDDQQILNIEGRATVLEARATVLEGLIDETVYTSEVQTENS